MNEAEFNYKNKKADKILTNLDEAAKKYDDKAVLTSINSIAELYREKPLDNKLTNLIIKAFTQNMDPVTAESIKADLQEMLTNKCHVVNEDTAKNVSKNIFKKLTEANISQETLNAIIPNGEEMVSLFKSKNLFKTNSDIADFQTLNKHVLLEIHKKILEYNKTAADKIDPNRVRSLIVNVNNVKEVSPIRAAFDVIPAMKLDSKVIANLRHFANIFDDFRAKNFALDEFAYLKVGSAPETVIANYWNDVSQNLLKTFGFTQDEIAKVSLDRNLFGNLLRDKIELIVSDKESYTKVLTELSQKVASINEKIPSNKRFLVNILNDNNTPTSYEKKVDSVFDAFANAIKDSSTGDGLGISSGFKRTANAIIGLNGDMVGTYKNLQKAYLSDRLLGVNSAFCRLINSLDMFRRIATSPNTQKGLQGVSREIKEELVELCKIITLQGHSSDHATKFYMHRNPEPKLDDFSDLEVKDGKVINKYFGKASETVDIPDDKYFYQNAMRLMFDGDMHPDTLKVLEKSILGDELNAFRKLSFTRLGGEYYFVKPEHLISAKMETPSDFKFLLTGIAPDELFYKAGQQAFNTNKWLKIFGGIGIGLLGITVLSQFFFGKIKTPQGNQK